MILHKNIILILLLISSVVYSQNKNTIFSKKFSKSTIVDIKLPKSYNEEGNDKRKYALTVLLNSKYLFNVYTGIVSLYEDNNLIPENITVGLNIDSYLMDLIDDSGVLTEYGKKYYDYVVHEVLGYMEKNFRVSGFKTIIATGKDANFINYILFDDNDYFNSYVCINTSWNNRFARQIDDKFYIKKETNYFIYMYSAGFENDEEKKTLKKTEEKYNFIDSELPNFRFKSYKEGREITKIRSLINGLSNSISYIYKIYSPISYIEYKNVVSVLSPDDALEYLIKKYEEIEGIYDEEVPIRDQDMVLIEGIVIDKNNGDSLIALAELYEKEHPKKIYGLYYRGLYYEKGGDYLKALKYYKKAYYKIPNNIPEKDMFFKNIERANNKLKRERDVKTNMYLGD